MSSSIRSDEWTNKGDTLEPLWSDEDIMPSSMIDILENHGTEDDIETEDVETEEGADVDFSGDDEGEDSDDE